ncbi:MAG: PRTRC system protein D [Pseudomonas sp.]
MSISPVIAAIDLGYGYTKYAVRTAGATVEDSFPSFAPTASGSQALGSHGALSKLRVVQVAVNGKKYLVGTDSVMASDGRLERHRDPAYCTTDAYHALTLAALSYMRQPVIDVLVLGLPLSTLGTYREYLEKKYTGRHEIPASDTLGIEAGPTTVDIRRVMVVPQPAGALLSLAGEHEDIKSAANLVVDLGYYTMDFLCTNGLRPLPARSGAVEGGMAAFYDELHAAASLDYAKANPDLPGEFRMPHHSYELALQRNRILRTSAGPLDLNNAIAAASLKIDQYLDAVAAKVGNTDDIINVVIAGGGADLLAPRFKVRFPRMRSLLVPKRPQFAIVQGFLTAGLSVTGSSK